MRCGESSLCPVVAILAFRGWVAELGLLGRAIALTPHQPQPGRIEDTL
jgi:hypothetical protein